MSERTREARVVEALVALASTLTEDYDVGELLDRLMGQCLDLVDVDQAGLLLESPQGELELVASTSEGVGFVEVMQLAAGDGPCIEAFRSGRDVEVPDLPAVAPRWPEVVAAAEREGILGVHAVPLRVGERTIGTMGLFRSQRGGLDAGDAAIARALADMGSIAILQGRALHESSVVNEQLQRALDSRVVIEQAKGVVAASRGIGVEEAFGLLRSYARDTNQPLRDVARAVAERRLELPGPGAPAALPA